MVALSRFVVASCVALVLAFGPPAFAQVGTGPNFDAPGFPAVEAGGTVVVAEPFLRALYRVDPVTGNRSVLSDDATGTGPVFSLPLGLAVEASGDIIVVDNQLPAVLRVDPITGDRTILSDASRGTEETNAVGSASRLRAPIAITIEASGDLVVTDSALPVLDPITGGMLFAVPGVIRIDPITGDRTLVSALGTGVGLDLEMPYGIAVETQVMNQPLVIADTGAATVVRVQVAGPLIANRQLVSEYDVDPSDQIGTGPSMWALRGIVVELGNPLLVSDAGSKALLRVHRSRGDRTVISNPVTGFGPPLSPYFGLAKDASGSLIVTDADAGALFRVNAANGNRTVLSAGIPDSLLASPNGMAAEADGNVVVVDAVTGIIARVDPTRGVSAILSSATTGSGPTLIYPSDVAVEAGGDLVVVVPGLAAVVRVHPVTGDRTVVSDSVTGTGTAFQSPVGIVVSVPGDLFVSDNSLRAVLRVNPSSGDRTTVSNAGTGTGPAFVNPQGIGVENSGDLIVADRGSVAVVRVNSANGNRTVVSNATTGSGPALVDPTGIFVAAAGDIFVVDPGLGGVVQVDPVSGDRTIVSDDTTGSGPALTVRFGIAGLTSGELAVADPVANAVVLLDPTTGDRARIQSASAASQTILGSTMTVKNGRKPSRRRIVATAKEESSPDSIVGDPTTGGATLELIANGANSTLQTFSLPQGVNSKGKPFWRATESGFKYTDRKGEQGAVQLLEIEKSPKGTFRINVQVNGRKGPIDVVPPDAGTDGGFALAISNGDRYCVNFGTDARSRNKGGKLWRIQNPQSEGCPLLR